MSLNWASLRSQRDFAAEALESDVTTPLRDTSGTHRALKRFFNLRRTRAWREALADLKNLELTPCRPMNPGRRVQEPGQEATSDDGSDFYFQDTARNLVLDTLARSARWREAFALVGEMRGGGVPVDVVKLNSVLKACSNARQWDVALRLLAEMRDPRGPWAEPDVVSFNTAIAACSRAGRRTEALCLLEEMWARPGGDEADRDRRRSAATGALSVSSASSVSSPPPPTLLSFNAALSACVRGDEEEGGGAAGAVAGMEKALGLLVAMRRGDAGAPSPDTTSFREVVLACGRAGQWERALSVVDEATKDGVEISPSLFAAAIAACGQSGQWRRALRLLREDMPRWAVVPDKHCVNATIRACARAGKVSEALAIIEQDVHRINAESGAGGPRPPKGARLLRPDAFSFSPVLDALAIRGDKDRSMGVLREIQPRTSYPPNAKHYRAVHAGFVNFGDEDGARSVLAEWRSAAEAARRDARGGPRPHDASFPGDAPQSPQARPSRSHSEEGGCEQCLEHLRVAKEGFRQASSVRDRRFRASRPGGGGTCIEKQQKQQQEEVEEKKQEGHARGVPWWEEVAAEAELEARVSQAQEDLRARYEVAISALGREGRCEEALELLTEASRSGNEGPSRAPPDPSCFVPALESSSRTPDPDDGGHEHGNSHGPSSRGSSKRAVSLLKAMEEEAGVLPTTDCVNAAMRACAAEGEWGRVLGLFEGLEVREARGCGGDVSGPVGGRHHRCQGGAEGGRSISRPREYPWSPKGNYVGLERRMGPTGLSYKLAAEACAALTLVGGAGDAEGSQREREERESGNRAAERALSLVRGMSDAGLVVRQDVVALANAACSRAGMWEGMRELSELVRAQESRALEYGGAWRRRGAVAAAEVAAAGKRLRLRERGSGLPPG